MELARNLGLKGATSTVYREVRERARLLSDALRGLEPAREPLEELFPTSDASPGEAGPAYDLTPRRATGT